MKSRHALLLVGLVAFSLGFALWRVKSGRDTRAVENAPADGGSPGEREVAELAPAASLAPDEPAAREALPAPVEQDASPVLAAPDEGEAALDIEVVAVETGAPLAGVRLFLVPLEQQDDWSSTHIDRSVARANETPATDELGRATFLVPAGTAYRLSTVGPGGDRFQREVTAPAPGERLALRIELRTASDQSFFGQVVDAETGAPLAGATARLEGGDGEPVIADAAGLFELPVRSFERSGVRVEHEGYAWTLVEARKAHATAEKAARIRLARSASLRVRIERVDGPVAGLEVHVHTDGYYMHRQGSMFWSMTIADPVWRAEVDAAGGAVVAGLPAEVPLTVDVYDSGRRIERLPELKLGIGEERELVIPIGSGCRILGSAFEQGGDAAEGLVVWLMAAKNPVRGPDVRYFEAYESDRVAEETRVDASGRFAFEDVAPGSWLIGPAPPGFGEETGVAPVATAIEITAEDRQKEITLEIHSGLTIGGRVVGPDGKNVPHVYVMDSMGRADCNSQDGTFTLGPLAPGEYELIVMPGSSGFARSRPVKARAGDQDVVLQVAPGGSVAVVVRGPDGETVAAEVSLVAEVLDATGFSMMASSSRGDGSCRFSGLRPGIYCVKATDTLGNVGVLRGLAVEANGEPEEQVVSLLPGARVLVRIVGQEEGDRRLSTGLLQDGIPTGFLGMEAPVTVVPGPVTVELRAYDPESGEKVVLETREVTALVGEEIEVVFDRTGER